MTTVALTSHPRTSPATASRRAPVGSTGAPVAAGPRASRVAAAPFYTTAWLADHPAPDLGVKAQAGIVVDLDRREVLWARGDRSPRAPASLAKLVTAMVALDHASLDQRVMVSSTAANVEPDVMGLTAGEVLTVRDLLYGLFLDSGNDAAEALAQGIMPRYRFLDAMNAKVAGWGLQDTHFSNPTGLDQDGLRSTAYDLAVITAHVELDHPELMEIAGSKERLIPATAEHKAFDPESLNKLLWQYPGATGLKTGFTDAAGGCVIGTATRGGRRLITVVLNDDIFFTDAGRLLDYGYSVSG